VFKSPTSVQLVPFHDSVSSLIALKGGAAVPANPMAAVLLLPAAPCCDLAKFKFATSVQLVPLYISVSFFEPG
jgi:hypothetical protein